MGTVSPINGHIDYTFPNWISVDFKLPEKSGKYLCCNVEDPFIEALDYSAKHKAFNADDSDTEKFVELVSCKITHWMPLPPLPGED